MRVEALEQHLLRTEQLADRRPRLACDVVGRCAVVHASAQAPQCRSDLLNHPQEIVIARRMRDQGSRSSSNRLRSTSGDGTDKRMPPVTLP